jgi:hypothetical protein
MDGSDKLPSLSTDEGEDTNVVIWSKYCAHKHMKICMCSMLAHFWQL